VPRERAELVKNADYWDKKRLAKVDRMILIPIPEALNRTNALLRGRSDLDRNAGARRRGRSSNPPA